MRRFRNFMLAIIIFTAMVFYAANFTVYAEDNADRLWGSDRYITSVEVSKTGWTSTSQYAVLVTGDDYPDALCASPLAKLLDAPILLTSKSKVEIKVLDELKRLNVQKVFIIGGTGVISDSIEKTLNQNGMESERLQGADRYLTSLAVANRIAEITGQASEVTVVTGENYPDALSIAPVAAIKGMPILLTEKSKLSDDISKYLVQKGVTKSYVIGGTGVVSKDVENKLPQPQRLEGNGRYETNLAVLRYFFNEFSFDKTYLATGNAYPDALAGAALAGKMKSPIILIDKIPGQTTQDFVAENRLLMKNMVIVGGEGAVAYSSVEPLLPKIASINNINQNVNEGESYTLPSKIVATLDNGTTKEVSVTWSPQSVDTNIGVIKTASGSVKGYSNTVDLTLNIMHPIMGKSKISAEQLADYLAYTLSSRGQNLDKVNISSALELAQLFIEEGEAEGVRGDIAFCQSFKETGYFQFGNDAKTGWNNYAGIGVTGAQYDPATAVEKTFTDGVTTIWTPEGQSIGVKFATPRLGVRAQIQHLKAYASLEPLNQDLVDPRFQFIKRGRAPFFEWLGRDENPENANREPGDRQGWAVPGVDYGHTMITNYYDKVKAYK